LIPPCGTAGRVLWSTPQAAEMLGQEHDSGRAVLTEDIRAWVVRCPDMAAEAGLATPLAMTARTGPAGHLLEISYVGRIGPNELLLRVVAADPSGEELLLKQRLGLTTREAEVLLWLGRGKTNRDIAEILSLSPRTVNKHLELIYAKIGVENRSSEAGIAIRAVGRL